MVLVGTGKIRKVKLVLVGTGRNIEYGKLHGLILVGTGRNVEYGGWEPSSGKNLGLIIIQGGARQPTKGVLQDQDDIITIT